MFIYIDIDISIYIYIYPVKYDVITRVAGVTGIQQKSCQLVKARRLLKRLTSPR